MTMQHQLILSASDLHIISVALTDARNGNESIFSDLIFATQLKVEVKLAEALLYESHVEQLKEERKQAQLRSNRYRIEVAERKLQAAQKAFQKRQQRQPV